MENESEILLDGEAGIPVSEIATDICYICATNPVTCVGECGHRNLCGECYITNSILFENDNCITCQASLGAVVVSRKIYAQKTSTEILQSLRNPLPFSKKLKAHFETNALMKATEKFVANMCTVCGQNFHTVQQLKAHVAALHDLEFCTTCLYKRKVFPRQQRLYKKSQLHHHRTNGDIASGNEGAIPAHVKCRLAKECRELCYDNEDLGKHMLMKHLCCQVCRRLGRGEQWILDSNALIRHYQQEHLICDFAECTSSPLENVFEDALALQSHIVKTHGHTISKEERKAASKIAVGLGTVDVATGGIGNTAGGGRAGSSRGANASAGRRVAAGNTDINSRATDEASRGDGSPNVSRDIGTDFPTLSMGSSAEPKTENRKFSSGTASPKGESSKRAARIGGYGTKVTLTPDQQRAHDLLLRIHAFFGDEGLTKLCAAADGLLARDSEADAFYATFCALISNSCIVAMGSRSNTGAQQDSDTLVAPRSDTAVEWQDQSGPEVASIWMSLVASLPDFHLRQQLNLQHYTAVRAGRGFNKRSDLQDLVSSPRDGTSAAAGDNVSVEGATEEATASRSVKNVEVYAQPKSARPTNSAAAASLFARVGVWGDPVQDLAAAACKAVSDSVDGGTTSKMSALEDSLSYTKQGGKISDAAPAVESGAAGSPSGSSWATVAVNSGRETGRRKEKPLQKEDVGRGPTPVIPPPALWPAMSSSRPPNAALPVAVQGRGPGGGWNRGGRMEATAIAGSTVIAVGECDMSPKLTPQLPQQGKKKKKIILFQMGIQHGMG